MSGFQQARMDLGILLRQLRENAQLSGKELAERLGWQASKVSRLENARQTASEDDVVAWAQAVRAEPAMVDGLIQGVMALLEQHDSWRAKHKSGLASIQEDMRELESRTKLLRVFEPGIVIGLLQTAEYARHVFTKLRTQHAAVDDVDEAIKVRMQRQEILYDQSRRFRFIMPEAVLRYRLAPVDAMRGQLDRLLAVTTLPNVEFGLVPFEAELPSALLNAFWIYNDAMVGVPTKTKELVLRDSEDIAFYIRSFDEFAEVAVFRQDARRVIMRCIEDYGKQSAG